MNKTNAIKDSPPKLAKWLLKRILIKINQQAVIGDFEETFFDLKENKGLFYAKCWFWRQTLLSTPASILNSFYWSIVMFKNYFKIAFRNMARHKLYSFINIFGLSIGIAVSMLIFLYMQSENKYDQHIENGDRIYRVESSFTASMPTLVGYALDGHTPEIEKCARIWYTGDLVFGYKENKFLLKNYVFADSTFFDIFKFEFISGSPEHALTAPLSIVLTESEAQKLFGKENPIGKIVLCENIHQFTVTGVIKDIEYFHMPFRAVASLITMGNERLKRYDDWAYPTYVLLPRNHNKKQSEEIVNNKLKEFGYQNQAPFSLRNLKEIYFAEGVNGERLTIHGDRKALNSFIMIVIFILIISGINFVNLSTARASLRMKEVGVKKVIGSSRIQIIRQFLMESILTCLLALCFHSGKVIFSGFRKIYRK